MKNNTVYYGQVQNTTKAVKLLEVISTLSECLKELGLGHKAYSIQHSLRVWRSQFFSQIVGRTLVCWKMPLSVFK